MTRNQTQAAADTFAGAMFIATADQEGEILADDAGEYIYWPKGCHGAFNAWTLRVFADELDRRNAALAAAMTIGSGKGVPA